MCKVRILIIALLFLSGCFQPNSPLTNLDSPSSKVVYSWNTSVGASEGYRSGSWNWSYFQNDSLKGTAELEMTPMVGIKPGWSVSWKFNPPLNSGLDTEPLYLIADNEKRWHSFQWTKAPSQPPIPLPKLVAASNLYSDILSLLRELTIPFFNQVVTHWPEYPIPIRLVQANSGSVDLTACLVEAVQRWNEKEPHPWFVLDSTASWGIRLVHFPDREMHPPLASQITRLDAAGRPLRISLLVGNNYQSPQAPPYVIRGFIHELAHTLFLWGHSQDRIHCLWGLAPPMVSRPSTDERKAARLWHGLPDGLDLSFYEISSP